MTSDDMVLTEIVDLYDPHLLPWLDLYETAFPPPERMLVSFILDVIGKRKRGEPADTQLWAVLDPTDALVGTVMFSLHPQVEVAFLWYLAVDPQRRSQGLGARIYQKIIQQIQPAGLKALVFEVEIPEGENAQNAWRRIKFYRREGAQLLHGIRYIQQVGWHQPPIPMHVMIHPLQPLVPATAFNLAKAIFKESIEQTGTLSLE